MNHTPDDHQDGYSHDTDNLTAFTILLFSVAGVMFTIAVTLIVFRISLSREVDRKVTDNPSERHARTLERAEARLHSSRDLRDDLNGASLIWQGDIEAAKKRVIEEYAR